MIGKEESSKEELEDERQDAYSVEKEGNKPYRKKSPTEPAKSIRKTTSGEQNAYTSRLKKVDLGEKRQRGRFKRSDIPKIIPEEKEEEFTEIPIRAVSPFVEIDFDKVEIFLVIPRQRFNLINKSILQKQLNYQIKLNDEEKILQVNVDEKREYLEVEEKRVRLEKPIQNFEVIFPPELGNRIYQYKHQNNFIYVFIAAGNSIGRMHYLYDINRNINPLPQKETWILLKEDFELGIDPNLIEDTWFWESYRPLLVNLKNVRRLIVKDRNTNEDKVIPCEFTFSIDGEAVIYDDFGERSPIFTGNNIEVKAPIENEEGWRVWIQNKKAGYKIVSDNWLGKEPLKLSLARNIPWECGEFQIDICEQDGRPVTTLFFRYIPSLQLNYPGELIIPDSKEGHKMEKIEVLLQNPKNWEIESLQQMKFISQSYEIYLPPEEDTLKFSISKKGKPETRTNFQITIPRLKWRTSRQVDWIDKSLCLRQDELTPGEDFTFFLRTNTSKRYSFLMILEIGGRNNQEQELVRKGRDYLLVLNQFYDTLKYHGDNGVAKLYEASTSCYVEVISFLSQKLTCKFCNFSSYNKEEIFVHIRERHLSEFFESLTLEELHKYDSSLPHKIYKCSYCGYYVQENDPKNPISSISSHIENQCLKADRREGYPRISFQVVENIDEIRRNVLPDLPDFRKCKFCGEHITTSNEEKLLEHLIKVHQGEIYMIGGE